MRTAEEGIAVKTRGRYDDAVRPQGGLALVVDDNLVFQEVLIRMLEVYSWAAVGASSGEEALHHLDKTRFDRIFLDLNMPGMNGLALLARIRELDTTVPVIFITAYPDSALLRHVDVSGPLIVLKKPVTLKELSRVLTGAS